MIWQNAILLCLPKLGLDVAVKLIRSKSSVRKCSDNKIKSYFWMASKIGKPVPVCMFVCGCALSLRLVSPGARNQSSSGILVINRFTDGINQGLDFLSLIQSEQ